MPTVVRAAPRLKPARLSWAWEGIPIVPCEILPEGLPGWLRIDDMLYMVTCIGELPAEGEPIIYGWRLTNQVNGNVYDLDAGGAYPSCECLGFLRWGHCKHVSCLHEALASLRKEVSRGSA